MLGPVADLERRRASSSDARLEAAIEALSSELAALLRLSVRSLSSLRGTPMLSSHELGDQVSAAVPPIAGSSTHHGDPLPGVGRA